MNWVWWARTRDDARNSIPLPEADVYCLTSQNIEGDLELESEPIYRYLVPLVVPPIYEKGPHYRDFLGPIWTRARRALEDANRLIVFGYSFPTADFSARSLFKAAFHQGSVTKDVSVIDSDPGVAALLTDFLELSACSFFRDVPSFAGRLARDT